MPIYEYECSNCGARFEKIKVVAQPEAAQVCNRAPKCQGKAKLVPSIPAPAQFNGPGFHATDYKGIK